MVRHSVQTNEQQTFQQQIPGKKPCEFIPLCLRTYSLVLA